MGIVRTLPDLFAASACPLSKLRPCRCSRNTICTASRRSPYHCTLLLSTGRFGPRFSLHSERSSTARALGRNGATVHVSISWLTVYLVTLGLPLIAAPALIFWTLRHREHTPLVWLNSIGLIGFIVPHFVTHQYSSNFARWIEYSQASLSLVLGIGVLTLLAQFTRRSLAWIILSACAALTIGWPLAVSIKNVTAERRLSIGKSIEDQWTLSPPLRQSHHVDLLTGRSYPFLMGGEARNFLRSLPPTARVLTNQFPEVPLLIRGFGPSQEYRPVLVHKLPVSRPGIL